MQCGKDGMCLEATPPLQRPLAGGGTVLPMGKPHIFGGFCKAFCVGLHRCLPRVAVCLWLFGGSFLPQLGCLLHPRPLEEHRCFSSFRRGKRGDASQLRQVKALLLSPCCECGRDTVQPGMSHPSRREGSSSQKFKHSTTQ